jgi:ATP-dependent DNA helicase RecG
MRPEVLMPLFAPVTVLPGVGPRLAEAIETLAGPRVIDLLWHLPAAVADRRFTDRIADAEPDMLATLCVRVIAHQPPDRPRQPFRVLCSDASATLSLVFFHIDERYLSQALAVGTDCVVSGRIVRYGSHLQMVHPDYVVPAARSGSVPRVETFYPQSAKLPSRTIGRLIGSALERLPALDEWIDPALRANRGWTSWRESLVAAHHPQSDGDLSALSPTRARLAFDELLANQLMLALTRQQLQQQPGHAMRSAGRLADAALRRAGFRLTPAQQQAIEDIRSDMTADVRMLRLLQGDVGSGKTVVAVLAMLHAVESGAQAAMMAPTEILARQHLATLQPLAEAAGVTVALLTGRAKPQERTAVQAALADGRVRIAVGTHALVQDAVRFQDLGLVVIDEQHRFGVNQRLDLAGKGENPDVLVMTATPIPRTLLMSAYGDMDVSRLTEKPPGRKPVDTRVISTERIDEVVAAVGRCIDTGGQVYWVCPLVAESEEVDAAAAEARYRDLQQAFGGRVGLLHGRMKTDAKEATLTGFRDGRLDIMVATTVIEVGVDVPGASAVVIEHAERFGLAQLHQLRGRVGRSDKPATCILLYQPPLNETARARLAILRETEDGFRIAEEDLRLRGGGDILGSRQTGLPAFRLADLVAHVDLLAAAQDHARVTLARDPHLRSRQGLAMRTLLHLFERTAAVRYLRSG